MLGLPVFHDGPEVRKRFLRPALLEQHPGQLPLHFGTVVRCQGGAVGVLGLGVVGKVTVAGTELGLNGRIIAAVLGGRRTILGAALGAVFLILANEFLRPLGQLNTFVVSAVALAVILFFPEGLLGYALHRSERE